MGAHTEFRGWAHEGRRRPSGQERAEKLLAWLCDFPNDKPLPPLKSIADEFYATSYYGIWDALAWLHEHHRIYWRHGTRSEARGHQAIRLQATGKILKTAGCPFEPPA